MKSQREQIAQAITTILEATRVEGPALTEQQFLREVVNFANFGYLGTALSGVPNLRTADVDGVHAALRETLQAIVDNTMTKGRATQLREIADRLVMVPHTDAAGIVRYRYLPESLAAAVAHGVRLLLDPSRSDLRSDLRQCKWIDCNIIKDARQLPQVRRFFFVSERREAQSAAGKSLTGKPPDQYCCEEHMKDAHRARATEATQKRRKLLRERKLKSTKNIRKGKR